VCYFLIDVAFALWNNNSEVKFTLTISQPEQAGDCGCGNYSTIQEGINLLKNEKYNYINNMMDQFAVLLENRISQLQNLPFGDITFAELNAEVNAYRQVNIKAFGDCIGMYGDCINILSALYRKASQKEKQEVPDFWDQHTQLWNLHGLLWDKRDELYSLVNEVWRVGETKIDYNKKK